MTFKLCAHAVVLAAVAIFLVGPMQAGGPKVEGSGTPGTIPQWTNTSTLGDSVITQSGGNVSVGGALAATGAINTNTHERRSGSISDIPVQEVWSMKAETASKIKYGVWGLAT